MSRPWGFEGFGAGEGLERGFGAEERHSGGEAHQAPPAMAGQEVDLGVRGKRREHAHIRWLAVHDCGEARHQAVGVVGMDDALAEAGAAVVEVADEGAERRAGRLQFGLAAGVGAQGEGDVDDRHGARA